MANKDQWVFNLHDETQGIARTLSEGTLHSHPQEQWGVLLEGELVRIQGGEEVHAKAGDFWCTPGGVEHSVRTGDVGATVLDVFAPPRDEYRKPGEGFSAD